MIFSKRLIYWYLQNKRDLPWRNTRNPYEIWLSEIILQQTRVAQGLPYFEAFISAFPTVFDLANASEEQVLKLWQGLGYYSRARNLHQTAQIIATNYKGSFPTTYNELLKLKGIGPYTAAAIASFSFDEAVPVVDGNVFRVLARYFGVETDISSHAAKKEFNQLAQEVMDVKQPALFNQAMMEFGSLQCVPANPNCETCIFNDSCVALQKKKVQLLPVKLKKTKVTTRYLNYLVLKDEKGLLLVQKRVAKGIWHNLYEFPLVETEEEIQVGHFYSHDFQNLYFQNPIEEIVPFEEKSITHKLSHQNLIIRFWNVSVSGILENGIHPEEAKKLPFPIVLFNFIEKNL
jgi:A/G-specific adenine glycosylase